MKTSALIVAALLLSPVAARQVLAQDASPRPATPSVDATEIPITPVPFTQWQAGPQDGPSPAPNHPPIGQIPPMPMPEETAPAPLSQPADPGRGVMHDSSTGETIEEGGASPAVPSDVPAVRGGGYPGADGGNRKEKAPADASK